MRKDFGKKTILFPMPVLIIGSYDESNKANAMNAAWGGIYDYNQIFISLGAHVSTDNIRKNKCFTVSFATTETLLSSDYVGLVSQNKEPDKIIKTALKENKSEKELTDYYIDEFKKTTLNIGSLLPNITPRVTEYIVPIINYIQNLIDIGAAYVVDGDVYFRVSKIKDYGTLSGINIEELKVGARIEENSNKESPLDFALWKKTDIGIAWDTNWGKGRPGWHTECCVMIDKIFPNHYIDIHGGGYDLKFPHHENEIAQSEATHHNKIAKFWMHNAFINFGNEKMSKSLGNVVFAKDLIEKLGGPVTRMVNN